MSTYQPTVSATDMPATRRPLKATASPAGRTAPQFGFGTFLLGTVAIFGTAMAVFRFVFGLGATTNLSDQFPWGLWIGIDVLTGVAIAGGAFTLAGMVHIFHIRRYEPLLRPAILTAMLGYMAVIIALLMDLGRPYYIWHPLIMWQPRSMLFEVAWCVMLYTTVLTLEFSPTFFERLGWGRVLRLLRMTLVPLVMVGIILSTLHQSSLGGLYLIASTKLDPLWYSPWIPVFFWTSAVGGGLAMVMVEASLSSRAFRRGLELDLLGGLAKITAVILTLYFAFKTWDLWHRGALDLLYSWRFQNGFFLAEMLLGVALPALLLALPQVRRHPTALMGAAILAVSGLVFNRVNVAIVGMWEAAGRSYIPSLVEFAVTAGIVALAILAFKVIATYLPVFEAEKESGARHRPARVPRRAPASAPAPTPVQTPAPTPAGGGGGAWARLPAAPAKGRRAAPVKRRRTPVLHRARWRFLSSLRRRPRLKEVDSR